MTRKRRRLIGVAVVAVVVAAGGSVALLTGGGDDHPGPTGPVLSRSAFTTRAEAICAAQATSVDPLTAAEDANDTGAAVGQGFRADSAAIRKLADSLARPNPPASMAGGMGKLVNALRDYADGLDELAGRVRSGQGVLDVFNANGSRVDALNRIAKSVGTTAIELGLLDCVSLG